MLRLSIIVNMYNTAKYMDRCMDTLLNQDIPLSDYEIIMVDDCSPDNSLEMANEYAAKYPNIKVRHHEKNKGLAGGRNTGVDAASGQYLCFVDPDDYIEKHSLAALLKQMDEEQLDMLRFNYQKVDEEYNYVADAPEEAAFDYTPGVMTGTEFLANRLGIQCYVWAYIYRTSLIKSNLQSPIRFIEGIYFDDTPWLTRVLQRAQRINCTPIRHQYYLQRGGSLVHTRNEDAIKRKVDGQLALLHILLKYKTNADPGCQGWYNRMIAHNVVHLLTAIAFCGKRETLNCYQIVKKMGVFPLSNYRASVKNQRKIILLNITPIPFLIIFSMLKKKI